MDNYFFPFVRALSVCHTRIIIFSLTPHIIDFVNLIMADFQKGFLNPQHRAPPRDRRNFIQRFWQDQIMATDKQDGNLAIFYALLVFGGGIVAARTIARDTIVPSL